MSSTIRIVPNPHHHHHNNAASASVYGTTPGGTPRISYSRDELLQLASSPLSRSPPNFVSLPAAISRSPRQDHHHHHEERETLPNSNPNIDSGNNNNNNNNVDVGSRRDSQDTDADEPGFRLEL